MSDTLILGLVAILSLVVMFAIHSQRRVRIRVPKTDIEIGPPPPPSLDDDDRRYQGSSDNGRGR